MPLQWKDISQAPKDSRPFWLATKSGGVMLEAWCWCVNRKDFTGIYSKMTLAGLKEGAPDERFLYAEMQAPKKPS